MADGSSHGDDLLDPLLFHDAVGPQVTFIELHRERRGSRCHRRYSPEAGRKEHSLGQGGGGGERILGHGP